MMTEAPEFQRARRPEQRETRRAAILDAARELLTLRPAQEISLREIARQLGGSKTGIVQYYETREALFLELLSRTRTEWLDELERRLPAPGSIPDTDKMAREITAVWATSLAERRVLSELWSILPAVIERNVSAATVRDFKLENREHLSRLARLVAERIPDLDEAAAVELANASVVLIIGYWPFANPTPAVREAIEDPRLAASRIDFAQSFGRSLYVHLAGLRRP